MGVNRGMNKIVNSDVIKRYSQFLESLNTTDRETLHNLLEEVNSYGYSVKMLSDLGFMDDNDLILVPIIQKYCHLFDDYRIVNDLFIYLGFNGNTISLPFLIDEFKKPNNYWDSNNPISWNFTRRWAISNSIAKLSKKKDAPDLMELILNADTHNDSRFIIEKLGKIKDERAYGLFISLLQDSNSTIQCGAISALSNYKNHAEEIIPLLVPFTMSKNDAQREISKKSIKKLSKYS